jgi:hypothetical protein
MGKDNADVQAVHARMDQAAETFVRRVAIAVTAQPVATVAHRRGDGAASRSRHRRAVVHRRGGPRR